MRTDSILFEKDWTNFPPAITLPYHARACWRIAMKLLSFTAVGKDYFGAVSGDDVVTLNDKIGQPNLRAALTAGTIEAMRKAAQDAKPDRKLSDIEFLPVIPRPKKILCAGINY